MKITNSSQPTRTSEIEYIKQYISSEFIESLDRTQMYEDVKKGLYSLNLVVMEKVNTRTTENSPRSG